MTSVRNPRSDSTDSTDSTVSTVCSDRSGLASDEPGVASWSPDIPDMTLPTTPSPSLNEGNNNPLDVASRLANDSENSASEYDVGGPPSSREIPETVEDRGNARQNRDQTRTGVNSRGILFLHILKNISALRLVKRE